MQEVKRSDILKLQPGVKKPYPHSGHIRLKSQHYVVMR